MASKSLTFNLFGSDKTASKAIRGVGAQADWLSKGFLRLGAVIASAFAVTRIVNFAKATVTEFAAAEAAQLRLSDAFARFPALADSSQEALQRLNEELMRKTRFDDDALASGQSILAQFGLTGKQLEKLTPLLADYAAKTGTDVTTAADQLGKALLGQGRALKSVGIDFEDAGSVTANYQQLIEGLSEKVAGFAEQDGATLSGRLEILKNGFGELKETVGGLFAPAVGELSDLIYDKLLPALDGLVERIGPKVQEFFENAGDGAGRFVDALSEAINTGSSAPLLALFQDLAKVSPVFSIIATVVQTLGPIMPVLADALMELGKVLTDEGVIEALSQLVVALLPPLAELLVAMAPLIPPIADFLKTILVPALQLAAGNIGQISILLDLLKGELSPEEFLRAAEGLPIIGDVFKGIGDTIFNVLNTVSGGFNTLITAIEGAVNGVRFLMGMGSIKLPRLATITNGANAWRVPQMAPASASDAKFRPFAAASGALVRATPGGSIGVVGEGRDDEAVLPLNREVYAEIGRGIALAGGGGRIEINANGVDAHTVAQMIYQRLSSRMAVVK